MDEQNIELEEELDNVPEATDTDEDGEIDIDDSKIINMEKFLNSLHTICSQADLLIFLIYNIITSLLDFLTHKGIDFREFFAGFAAF